MGKGIEGGEGAKIQVTEAGSSGSYNEETIKPWCMMPVIKDPKELLQVAISQRVAALRARTEGGVTRLLSIGMGSGDLCTMPLVQKLVQTEQLQIIGTEVRADIADQTASALGTVVKSSIAEAVQSKSGIVVVCGDIHTLDIPTGTFGMVDASFVFHQFVKGKALRLFQSIEQGLIPHGALYLVDVCLQVASYVEAKIESLNASGEEAELVVLEDGAWIQLGNGRRIKPLDKNIPEDRAVLQHMQKLSIDGFQRERELYLPPSAEIDKAVSDTAEEMLKLQTEFYRTTDEWAELLAGAGFRREMIAKLHPAQVRAILPRIHDNPFMITAEKAAA